MEDEDKTWSPPPVMTPRAREDQMIVLAMDLAEQQLREGVATTPVITHYLKLATERERLERLKLENENRLLEAKQEHLESQKRTEEMYEQAIAAMRSYSGHGYEDEDEYY